MIKDILTKTLAWFEKAVRQPNSKNLHTQVGVHLEEVNEMLMEISTPVLQTQQYLDRAKTALHALSTHLKSSDNVIIIADREKYLDALCDQIVTATGCAHMSRLNILGAMDEVNRSNFSKFVNDEPIFNENMKVMKGPAYTEPDLAHFV